MKDERDISREKGRARTRAEVLHERRYRELRREFREGNMPTLLERYLSSCGHGDAKDGAVEGHSEETNAGKGRCSRRKEKGTLPNPAGFCRFFGISRDAYGRLEAEFPTEIGRMRAVFEDEALNSEMPVSVLGFYLRYLLGAVGDEDDAKPVGGDVLVTFEHDILSDGR